MMRKPNQESRFIMKDLLNFIYQIQVRGGAYFILCFQGSAGEDRAKGKTQKAKDGQNLKFVFKNIKTHFYKLLYFF